MIRVEVPGSSFMLCLGPGPSSLLHLTRANAEKPYAGDTLLTNIKYVPVTRTDTQKYHASFHFNFRQTMHHKRQYPRAKSDRDSPDTAAS